MHDTAPSLLLVDVELEGRAGSWVSVAGGRVAATGGGRPPADRGVPVVEGAGGALLPGLHDHHLHLLAMAARPTSVDCSPGRVSSTGRLGEVLRAAAAGTPPGTWLRGHGVDDTVLGPLDAATLDLLLGPARDRPTRLQHRSGHLWVLNTAGLEKVRVADPAGWRTLGAPEDRAAGLFYDLDGPLRARWGSEPPHLAPIGARLAARGVTGVTDATVTNDRTTLETFAAAQAAGHLPQRVLVLGAGLAIGIPDEQGGGGAVGRGPGSGAGARGGDGGAGGGDGGAGGGDGGAGWRLAAGAHKIVLSDRDPPPIEELVDEVRRAGPVGVAVHCASRQDLVLAATALAAAGGGPHRIEHASVAPPELVAMVAGLGASVVTQPGFVREHGDRYLRQVEADDLPWLYRLAAWRHAGVPLAAGSDAPFGDPDPWVAMAAAVERRTAGGAVLGPDEGLTPEEALALHLGPLRVPGGSPRVVRAGVPADLCLLAGPWVEARRALDQVTVVATVAGGRLAWWAGDHRAPAHR